MNEKVELEARSLSDCAPELEFAQNLFINMAIKDLCENTDLKTMSFFKSRINLGNIGESEGQYVVSVVHESGRKLDLEDMRKKLIHKDSE